MSSTENAFVWRTAGLGAVAAVVLAPLAAALVAIVYRFPVPMAEDYARGFGGAGDAALGSVFYLILGGALVLAILGGIGGFVTARFAQLNARRAQFRTLAVSAGISLLAASALAVLEFFIGAW
ncbi:hypothetical protein F3087_07265 [Nocardia colli]|uniref:Uncharacterized protein n=1 Tax=Nocardia colli TaxID=2545717 RepID=A0A5N0ELB2_9NOCA|nr:hypothetical protein [Nocardia colli]KAA8888805.1 hypothetical protein F3087_07265 [Nocardia colli]